MAFKTVNRVALMATVAAVSTYLLFWASDKLSLRGFTAPEERRAGLVLWLAASAFLVALAIWAGTSSRPSLTRTSLGCFAALLAATLLGVASILVPFYYPAWWPQWWPWALNSDVLTLLLLLASAIVGCQLAANRLAAALRSGSWLPAIGLSAGLLLGALLAVSTAWAILYLE